MARIATLASLKKDEDLAGATEMFAGGGGQGGSNTSMLMPRAGDKDIDAVFAAGSSSSGAPASEAVRVEIFRNGFRINGGEFRSTTGMHASDANRKFLQAIGRREVPRELEDMAGPDGDVPLSVTDRRGEDFDPVVHGSGAEPTPAATLDRFGGAGRSLGGASEPSGAAASSSASHTSESAGVAAAPTLDTSLPTLALAVRLATGKRARVTLNESHTVAQLIAHVAALCDCDGRPFTLLSGYPPKPITDMSATLLSAGLKGASVQQQST